MGTLSEDIFATLQADPAVSARVGDRVFPVVMPMNTPLPAIVYQIITETPENNLSGAGPRGCRIQVDAWGETYTVTDTMGKEIGQAFVSSGIMPGTILINKAGPMQETETGFFRSIVEFSQIRTS